MAGYGSLAKVSQREIVFGATTSEEAKIVLTICKKLELPLSIWLNVSTGSDAELVEELKANKANINVDQCRELFDDPDMYAFQKYISNPAKYLWAPIHTHSGPAPFPALTAYFSEVAAEDMMAFVFSKFPGRKVNFIAPAFPGISLAVLINVNCKQSLKPHLTNLKWIRKGKNVIWACIQKSQTSGEKNSFLVLSFLMLGNRFSPTNCHHISN